MVDANLAAWARETVRYIKRSHGHMSDEFDVTLAIERLAEAVLADVAPSPPPSGSEGSDD